MGIISTDKLKQGMVLDSDVRDIAGRLLLKKGLQIDLNHVKTLKRWGITEVNIIDSIGEKVSVLSAEPDQLEEHNEKTKDIFRHCDFSHPAVKELFRLAVLFRPQNEAKTVKKDLIEPDNNNSVKFHDIREKIIERKIKLPEIPSIVFELNKVIVNPLSTANDISQVVSKSPSLTASLLRIVNSSFYGLPSKIDSISRAVTLIGTKEITGLALGINTLALFRDIPGDIVDMYAFVKHSVACGIVSRILAAYMNLQLTEQFFVSGLLHDVGKLILYKYFPVEAKNILRRAIELHNLFFREEMKTMGCNHTHISRFLWEKWKLPPSLADNIIHHHNPSDADNPFHAGIVHLADIMVNGLGIGSSGERYVPPLDNQTWESLGLSPNSFEVIIQQANHQLFVLEAFLQ
ncbi:MAG: HDOD domain-containing protein [Deltaproteobacteria bacterium]|nr:HDOD domain-containing protein [Deltaproteobacteria bacterium]